MEHVAGDVSTKMAKDAKQVGILQAQADYKGLKKEIKKLMPEIRGIGKSVGWGWSLVSVPNWLTGEEPFKRM